MPLPDYAAISYVRIAYDMIEMDQDIEFTLFSQELSIDKEFL